MQSRSVSSPSTSDEGTAPNFRTIVARDVSTNVEFRSGPSPSEGNGRRGVHYFGYHFEDSALACARDYSIIVSGPALACDAEADSEPSARPPGRRFRRQRASLKSNSPVPGRLSLTICGRQARVETDTATWSKFTEPVMLVVAQVWRLQELERRFEELSEGAERDLICAEATELSLILRRRRLLETAREVRSALLKLPQQQGLLLDPTAYCSGRRSARVCQILCRRLSLSSWQQAIDAKAEAVEGLYDVIADKVYHAKMYFIEIIIELLIVVILLSDVALHFGG
jgi:hypothetical protein